MTPADVDRLAAALVAGEVVLLPTDTVYGLAASLAEPAAVDHLFELKDRPPEKRIAVLVADAAQAAELAEVDERAQALMARWWPGPLTLVLPLRDPKVNVGEPSTTVGVRCPDHGPVRELARLVGPLATTSANRSGAPTPATAAEVLEQLGHPAIAAVDGGPCAGAPSTVLDLAGPPTLLRVGALTADVLRRDPSGRDLPLS